MAAMATATGAAATPASSGVIDLVTELRDWHQNGRIAASDSGPYSASARQALLGRLRQALLVADQEWALAFVAETGMLALLEVLQKFTLAGHMSGREGLEFIACAVRTPAGLGAVASSERTLVWIVSWLTRPETAAKILDICLKVACQTADGLPMVVVAFTVFAGTSGKDPWLLLAQYAQTADSAAERTLLTTKTANFCETILERTTSLRMVNELAAGFARAGLVAAAAPVVGATPAGSAAAAAAAAAASGDGAQERFAANVQRFRAGIKGRVFSESEGTAVLKAAGLAETNTEAVATLQQYCAVGIALALDRVSFELKGFDRIDPGGVKRGACSGCRDCHQYARPGSGGSCAGCGHKASTHHAVREGVLFGSLTAAVGDSGEVQLVCARSERAASLDRSGGMAPSGPGAQPTAVSPAWHAWHERGGPVIKIVVGGPAGAGKTTLIGRLAETAYAAGYTPTVGVRFSFLFADTPVGLALVQLWDCAGKDRMRLPPHAVFAGAAGAVLVFDVGSEASFAAVRGAWLGEVVERRLPAVLLGNKNDTAGSRQVSGHAQALAASSGLHYCESSARLGRGCEAPFQMLVAEVACALAAEEQARATRGPIAAGAAAGPASAGAAAAAAAAGSSSAEPGSPSGAAKPAPKRSVAAEKLARGAASAKAAASSATRKASEAMGESCALQ